MKNILIVAKYTFIEIYKSKILLNIILLGFSLMLISYVASEFSYGVQAKVALDFGLGSMYLVIIGISIFIGVSLVARELESRTVHMILSRPIRRVYFLIGKIVGMSSILFVNILILGIIILLFYLFLGGDISTLMLWTLFFSLLESIIILLVVIFFSLITNATMSVIYTICIFILGHVIGNTILIKFVRVDPILTWILKIIKFFTPNLDMLNLRDHVIYQQVLSLDYYMGVLFYAFFYILFLLIIIIIIFERKQLD